jgi:hypothetical protein
VKVGVGVLVRVYVGVMVLVTVNVGVLGFTVGVAVNVLVGVNVGVQQMTSAFTQFEYMLVPPFMSAWLEIGPHVVALAHHVSVPV